MRLRATASGGADRVPPNAIFGPGALLGASLVDAGRLRPDDIDIVLRTQRETGLRFGEAAVRLGLIDETDLHQILSRHFSYPVLEPGSARLSPKLVAAFRPRDPFVQTLRRLRSQIQLHWASRVRGPRSLAIVGAARGEGRSFLAANLSIVFAQMGARVLLIDADLRHPSQDSYFCVAGDGGLSMLLSGRPAENAIKPTSLPGLFLLPVGPTPPNPEELLSRPALGGLLRHIGDAYDVLIFDTPALNQGGDAQLIAAHADQALVVTCKDSSHIAETKRLVDQLQSAGVEIIGSVLNTR